MDDDSPAPDEGDIQLLGLHANRFHSVTQNQRQSREFAVKHAPRSSRLWSHGITDAHRPAKNGYRIGLVPTSSVRTVHQLSAEEKALAAEEVLCSRTFQKSELLIRFLRYICEQERNGQASKISEYGIATEALGRQPDFSPESDSSVRSRAHALRRKLEDCYREELAESALRIVLPKGSYVPEYHVVDATEPLVFPEPTTEAPAATSWWHRPMLRGVALGLLLGVAGSFAALKWRESANLPEVLARAWGPLLDPTGEVLLVVGVPKQFWAREFPAGVRPRNEKWYPELPQDEQLKRWFYQGQLNSGAPGSYLLLHPNVGSPLWGDVVAASGAAEVLTKRGITHRMLPERVLRPYALRGRSALLFGLPEYSPSLAQVLKSTPFTIQYDPDSKWEAVINRQPKQGEPQVIRRDRPDSCMGLITVLTETESGGGRARTVGFSGLTSAGTQAALEFFSSPHALSGLWTRFRADGMREWPGSYQVVVEASTDTNLPIKFAYKAHRLIAP